MHPSVHFFVLILVSLSYDQLAKHLLVEARELSSNGGFSFAVDLIHRNSPLSPYHNSSMTPKEMRQRETLGSISHNHNFRMSSPYNDQKDSNVYTQIIPNGGDYLMKIAIGTPPVEFIAVADTGSDLVWVQCSGCQQNQCIPQEEPFFDPTKSSTFHTIPCNSESCYYSDLQISGCSDISSDRSCVYAYKYGDNTQTIGTLNQDTITLASADTSMTAFPSSTFGCGLAQQGSFGHHGDGLIGLGAGPLSLTSQLGPSINYKFSYCLTPQSSGSNSKLKFGLDVMGPGVVSTPFVTDASPTFYKLTLDGISIGNSSVPVGMNVIIDSGTTFTYLESSVYDGVRTAMKGAIGLSTVPDPEMMFDPCYEAQQLGEGFNPPDVVFHFEGADFVVEADNTFIKTKEGLVCLGMVPTDGDFIFGNVAQVNYEVGYDLQAKQVSFAPKDCTNY